MEILHGAAARALADYSSPGLLQLVTIPSDGGPTGNRRYPLGAGDTMADAAIASARAGLNVYVEGRTLAPDASGRGDAAATRYVFAFVDDADHDKGKGGSLSLQPSLTVETSPGNRHAWLFLDFGIPADEADRIGRAMRAAVGSDSATAKLTQPYRVAGTPNFPDARKRARGRVVEATRILEIGGPAYTMTQLAEAFPAVQHDAKAGAEIPKGRSGKSDPTIEELAAVMPDDGSSRSDVFWNVVTRAKRIGMLPDDLEELFRSHPGGCAEKYLEPYDRLTEELHRVWKKLGDRPTVPPHYPDRAVPVDAARTAMRQAIRTVISGPPSHRAVRVGTGAGKTRAAVGAVAEDIRARRATGDHLPWIYAVPRHDLGEEIASLFQALGVSARVYRGRSAEDPDLAGTGVEMCLDLKSVGLAQQIGANVARACCKGEDLTTGRHALCAVHSLCGYQRQLREQPDVWIVPHQILFRGGSSIGDVAGVVIDGSFWQAGVAIEAMGITLDELATAPDAPGKRDTPPWYFAAARRGDLARALRLQTERGGVARRHLVEAGITTAVCTEAIRAEWAMKATSPMWPCMPEDLRRAATDTGETAQHVGQRVRIWEAARDLLDMPESDAVSGRLVLDWKDTPEGRAAIVRAHSVRPIARRWFEARTLIMDATLPAPAILRCFYPDVEVVADVEAKAPHARVRQVIGAPISAAKLINGPAKDSNLVLIRRALIHRFVELGRLPMLVVTQKEVEGRLMLAGLPKGIALGHFNALAGLDEFKGVRALCLVGRTLPTVVAAETLAGVLTGREVPRTALPADGKLRWYGRDWLGLRMAGGDGFGVQGDRHPDPTAEAVRWQVCEGELMQALGRARAVNRTAESPVAIDILSDVVLPVTVDAVVQWEELPSGPEAEMLASGIVLSSPADMAAIWPKAWPSAKAAERWREKLTSPPAPIETLLYRRWGACGFRYRHRGTRQKWRTGTADAGVIADQRGWREARLGQLAAFENVSAAVADPEPQTFREAA